MNSEDMIYLGKTVAELAGIPVRLYRGTERIFFHSTTGLPADPAVLYTDELFRIREHVGYFITEELYNYGIVNHRDLKLVVGPARQISSTDQELRSLAFRADIPAPKVPDFVSGMKMIIQMPLESMLQMLCTVNFAVNGEKIEVSEIQITQQEQDSLEKIAERRRAQRAFSEDAPSPAAHNTMAVEEKLLEMIRRGEPDALREWLRTAPAVRGGTIAANQLRQWKNIFIVTATLASRAAIRGGLDQEEALSMSDRFIQNCELLRFPEQITNLQYHMVLSYAEKVRQSRRFPSDLAAQTALYVQGHLFEPVTAQAIANALYISRPYLSRKFKKDTGENLTDFILRTKTEEAMRLLKYTEKSASEIGNYLGFSSQAHFSRVFLKYCGMTPGEYRKSRV